MEEEISSNDFRICEEDDMNVYKKDAISVIFFKIVYRKEDITSKLDRFNPTMAHQVFGERESIFGYRSLSINLYYLHNSMRCYIDLQKSKMIKGKNVSKADNIMQILDPWLPNEYTTDNDEFQKMLENETHDLMFGTVMAEFQQKNKVLDRQINVQYKVTKCDIDNEDFQKFHSRFETFLVWYIDGANPIDLNDTRWMLYFVYEEYEDPITKEPYISPVAYCSIYKFFAYPNNIRARISQFFVLPPHQRKGIGKRLYRVVYEDLKKMPEVVDITVEEPTPHFQRIRDYEDCVVVRKHLADAGIKINITHSKKLFEQMRRLKICKKQSRKVLDILGCFEASLLNNGCYESYLSVIKGRVTSEADKSSRTSKRIEGSEIQIAVTDPSSKEALIEREYNRCIEDIEPSLKYLQEHFQK